VAFSPDGRRLASASSDKTVKVWEAYTGEELHTLRGHTTAVYHVAFSPDVDGRRLASASSDRTVKVWEPSTGKELLTLRGHTDLVEHVVFSPDGQRLASASWDGTVILWESVFDPASRTQRRQAWREQQAKLSEESGQFFAAAFHNYYLAGTWAEQNKWRDADVCLEKTIKFDPTRTSAWTRRALVLRQLGDRNGQVQLLKQALERFGKSDNVLISQQLAWMCVLQPLEAADASRAVVLAEKAWKLDPARHDFCKTLGAALYRAGRHQEALKHLQAARTAHGKGGDAWELLFLALAEHHVGHDFQAQECLRKAIQTIDASAPALTWDERLELRLMRATAKAVLKTPAAPKSAS
jgi:tetratricopeptide (TPR) repeat protein